MWTDDLNHPVDTGKAESDQQVNAERSKDRFCIRLPWGKDTPEDRHHDENIEKKTEHDAENRKRTGIGAQVEDTLHERWHRK